MRSSSALQRSSRLRMSARGDVRGPSRAEDGEDVVIGGALELDEAQRAHRRSMLLHEQADQVTEGLAGLAFGALLGLGVLAESRPRPDLSRGLASPGQREIPDAADRVALQSTASEITDRVDAGPIGTDTQTEATYQFVGIVGSAADRRQDPHVSVGQLHLPRRSRRAILHVRCFSRDEPGTSHPRDSMAWSVS